MRLLAEAKLSNLDRKRRGGPELNLIGVESNDAFCSEESKMKRGSS